MLLLGAFLFSPALGVPTARAAEAVQNASEVGVEYSILDEQGSVIESNRGENPLWYTHGQGQIIRGLEKALEGTQVGEQKTVKLRPEDAYGPINRSAFREVPRGSIPPEFLKLGARLLGHTAHGQSHPGRIHEIKEKTVVVDLNHPLAGRTLTFEVKILAIRPAKK